MKGLGALDDPCCQGNDFARHSTISQEAKSRRVPHIGQSRHSSEYAAYLLTLKAASARTPDVAHRILRLLAVPPQQFGKLATSMSRCRRRA